MKFDLDIVRVIKLKANTHRESYIINISVYVWTRPEHHYQQSHTLFIVYIVLSTRSTWLSRPVLQRNKEDKPPKASEVEELCQSCSPNHLPGPASLSRSTEQKRPPGLSRESLHPLTGTLQWVPHPLASNYHNTTVRPPVVVGGTNSHGPSHFVKVQLFL